MATMKDVARLAGVSTSTVSHVINKDRFVSEAITAKVEAAIKELNYAPSALARSLKLNQNTYHWHVDHCQYQSFLFRTGAWR